LPGREKRAITAVVSAPSNACLNSWKVVNRCRGAARHARDLAHLADYFGVSSEAMRVRIETQVGAGRHLIGTKS
jgi:hypothetical protein